MQILLLVTDNNSKEEDDHRNYFMITIISMKVRDRAGIKLVTPGSAVGHCLHTKGMDLDKVSVQESDLTPPPPPRPDSCVWMFNLWKTASICNKNQNHYILVNFDLRRIKDFTSLCSGRWKITQTVTVIPKPNIDISTIDVELKTVKRYNRYFIQIHLLCFIVASSNP